MSFEENFRDELEYQGLSVKELAYKIGVKPSTLYSYISGHKSSPTAEVAVKIAKGLNITVEYLMRGTTTITKSEKTEPLVNTTLASASCIAMPSVQKQIPTKRGRTINDIIEDLRALPDDELEILQNIIKSFADRARKKTKYPPTTSQ